VLYSEHHLGVDPMLEKAKAKLNFHHVTGEELCGQRVM
jgi:hypothetical protein